MFFGVGKANPQKYFFSHFFSFHFFMRFKFALFFFLQNNEGNLKNKNGCCVLTLSIAIVPVVVFLQQDNVNLLFLNSESLRELFVFCNLNFSNISRTYFFSFNIQNNESNCWIIFSRSFSIFNNLFLPSYNYLWMICCLKVSVSHSWFCQDFNVIIAAYWRNLPLSFFLSIVAFFFFIQSGTSKYEPPRLEFILQHFVIK